MPESLCGAWHLVGEAIGRFQGMRDTLVNPSNA